jgi:hypothetical protein
MKKYTLVLVASLISSMAFAQILPFEANGDTMSGEITLNSAEEINIALPFDPLEIESGEQPQEEFTMIPQYSLNSATYVKTGPVAIIAFILIALLAAGVYNYRTRSQKD